MQVCGWCGQEFAQRGSRPPKFCSNPCRLAALNALPRRKAEGFFSRQVTPKGYIRGAVWDDGQKRVLMEHRWVMENAMGRRLTAAEVVHHRNGVRSDNRIENLELYTAGHSAHLHDEHSGPRAIAYQQRQAEIVRLLGTGLRQSQIARTLGVSEATVSNHLKPLGLRARGPHHEARPSV